MLQIKNLNLSHKKDLHSITEDFNLVLNPGDKAAVIGEEGNGKSTLLKWIYEPRSVEEYMEASGKVIYTGENLGYLPQELPEMDRGKSLYEFFCEEPLFWEQTPGQLGSLVRELGLSSVEFFYGEQLMGTLSGGEKVKAQMARILMAQPTVLLLDEPSNDIDIGTLEWLEDFIKRFEQIILYVSHDETLIQRTANVIIHMEQIRKKTRSRYTVARLTYEEYLSQRRARMENQSRMVLNERRQEKIQQEKLRHIMQKVEREQNNISRQDPHGGRLLKKKMKAVKSMERRYERQYGEGMQMPESEEAIFLKFGEDIHIPGNKMVLDFHLDRLTLTDETGKEQELARDLELSVKGGEKICIVGKNGCGKTTLLKKIAQQLSVREDLHATCMPQNYQEELPLELTPVEYLENSGKKEEITKVRTYLGAMKYTSQEMMHPIAELSGGQKAKLLLLKMSLEGADVLILDEPTRNFSPLSNPVIRKVLRGYGGAIISVSHDRKYIEEVCTSCYELTVKGLRKMQ